MWKWFSPALLAILAASWFSGCEQPPATKEKLSFAQMLLDPSDSSGIRGSHPGDSPEEVRKRETLEPEVNTDTLLIYAWQRDFDERPVEVMLFYSFDEFGLFEFQFDLRPESGSEASALFRELETLLTARYGEPIPTRTGLRFTSFSPSNNVVEITLSDESKELGSPFVSLNFLEPLDDEI